MRGVNKVILIGNLGQDPETRYLPNGGQVCNLSLATSERWKDKHTGEDRERTEWHRVVLYRQLAEIAERYLRKGAKVYLEGKLQTRKWQDRDGHDRYTTEVIGDQLQMLDSRPTGTVERPPPAGQAQAARDFQAPAGGGFDDDVPF